MSRTNLEMAARKESHKKESFYRRMGKKKKKEVRLFDSTSNVQIIGTKELGQNSGKDEDLMIKPKKNTGKSPDR